MAGLTATGFLALRLPEVRTEIEAAWRTAFGANADLAADSPDGQIVGIMSEREAALWEQLAAVYASRFIDSAAGAALDEIASFAGITRLQESASVVGVVAAGTAATVLPAGRVIRLNDTATLWTLTGGTIGGGGTVALVATAQVVGPAVALSGSAWTIVTPVTGWVGIVSPLTPAVANPLDAEVGRIVESDEALRVRTRLGFVALGSTADGIRSAVSRVTGVLEVIVMQNVLYTTDADGRPPKSFEVIVRGGDDNEIAQAIWSTKPDGIEAYGIGVDSGSATTALGTTEIIPFTRPEEVEVWIEIDLTTDRRLVNGIWVTSFPTDGAALVLLEALAYEELMVIGRAVVPFEIIQGIETPGIRTAVIRVGRSDPPVQTTPLTMSGREIAALDSSRITVAVL